MHKKSKFSKISVSIIVPILNAEKTVEKCLIYLEKQTYKGKTQIIIVLDKRTCSKTLDIIKNYVKKYKNIKLLICNKKGAGNARNFGVRYAKGKYLFFTDADCKISRNWIELMEKKLKESKKNIGIVGGSDPFLKKNGILNEFMRLDNDFRTPNKEGYTNFIDTNNFGIKKNIFKRIGGFNKNLHAGEDVDLSLKIKKLGLKLYFDPKIKVFHNKSYSLFSFIKESYQHSYDLANVWLNHKRVETGYYLKNILIIQPILWGYLFFSFFLGIFYKTAQFLTVILFLLILLMNLIEVFHFMKRKTIIFGIVSSTFLMIRSIIWFFGGLAVFLKFFYLKFHHL